MDGSSGRRPLLDDPVAQRLVLGLEPGSASYVCADCDTVTEPGYAPLAKTYLVSEFLRCEKRLFDLFLDPSLAARAMAWLADMGCQPGAAAELIGAARELGLLDGDHPRLRMAAAKCADCYLQRGAAFETRRERRSDT
jgi:hypothetical protein